jgi:hypothetical protein
MFNRQTIQDAVLALGFAAATIVYSTSTASAETINPTNGPQVVRVETPSSGAVVHGNVTFLGIAVDCGTGQPASRVAVYDGPVNPNTYFADVSMDTARSLRDSCVNQSGSANDGFTLIIDSNRLSEGRHTLTFVAEYANGSAQTTINEVNVDNVPTRNLISYPARYAGVFYGGYTINGIYTPSYTRCTGYNVLGQCLGYQTVATPVVTATAYPGCVTNVYGNCVSYPYTSAYYNAYAMHTYLSGLSYWNGVAWVLR